MKTTFLDTPEDTQWLRDTHLRGVPLPTKYMGFRCAILQGNEDAPHSINLYMTQAPNYQDDYLHVTFDHAAPVYCECIEFDGRTVQPKRSSIIR
jgi:hypothetical protein